MCILQTFTPIEGVYWDGIHSSYQSRVVRPPPSPDAAKTGSSTRHTTQTRKTGISHVRFPSVSPETHPNSLKQQQQRGKQNTHPLETPVPTTAPPAKNQSISYTLNKTYQPETHPLLCAEFRLQPYEPKPTASDVGPLRVPI